MSTKITIPSVFNNWVWFFVVFFNKYFYLLGLSNEGGVGFGAS